MIITTTDKRAEKRSESPSEALVLGENVGGFIYCNGETGECTTDQDAVLGWVAEGNEVRVSGYFTFEWDGQAAREVWH